MIQRLIIDGQPEYVEFTPSILEDDSEHNRRIWALNNGKVHLSFVEEPLGKFSAFLDIMPNIKFDAYAKEEMKVRIYEILDDYIQQERYGIEPQVSEPTIENKYPYDPRKIIIHNYNWSVDTIFKLLNKGTINLSPDFQRNFVWDLRLQSLLIESILLGIPVPAFYLAKSDKGYQVVDGLQRLTTVKRFLNNEFPLKYLEYLHHDLNNRYFVSKDNKIGIGEEFEFLLSSTQFNVNVIDSQTPNRVKFDVFRRVNTAGKPLNSQEIRNCVMEDGSRKLVKRLAESESFKKATGYSIAQTRMEAEELVMRFIGFWYIKILKIPNMVYQGDMQTFLDDLVLRLNEDADKYHSFIEKDFENSMVNAIKLFGQYAFRKCLPEHLKSGAKKQLINKSLFTTWSVLLSNIELTFRLRPGTFSRILAENLSTAKVTFGEDIYGEEKLTYFEAVSYKTNDKRVLEYAFKKTNELIQSNLLT